MAISTPELTYIHSICLARSVQLFDELNSDKTCKFTMSASHMEIYLEQPYDLLASDGYRGKWKAGTHMNQVSERSERVLMKTRAMNPAKIAKLTPQFFFDSLHSF